MRSLKPLGVAGLFALVIGCGGAPPPPPAPPPAPPPPAPVAEPQPDMSPVSEPKNLVAMGRWKSVSATIQSAETLFKVPGLEALAQRAIGDKDVADVLKLDSSVDVAALLDPAAREPEFFVAFSIPLKSFEQAKSVAQKEGPVTQVRPGVVRIGKTKGSEDITCEIALSLGDAPARLVCGERDRDLDALLPWMTRGMPNAPAAASDLHLEFRAGPMRERFQPMLEIGARQATTVLTLGVTRELGITDQPVLDAIGSLVQEGVNLANDVDALSIDASLDSAKSTASVKGSLQFRSTSSWLVKVMTSRNDKAGPAPDVYWDAPKDADSAMYARGVDPSLYEPLRKSLSQIVSAAARSRLADADRKTLEDLVARMPIVDAASFSSNGHVEAEPGKAEAKKVAAAPKPVAPGDKKHARPAGRSPQEVMKDALERFDRAFGWHVMGFDAKGDVYAAWFRDVVAFYNRPSVQNALKKDLKPELAKLLPTIRTVGAAGGFPKGTLGIEASMTLDSKQLWSLVRGRHDDWSHPDKAKPAKQTFKVVFFIVPDGANRTLLALGTPTSPLKEHLAMAKTGAAKDGTIATRDGLDDLKNEKTTSGGFFTLAGFVNRLTDNLRREMSNDESAVVTSALAQMPNKGKSPVIVLVSGNGGATPSTSIEVRAHKGTIDDIAALIGFGMSLAMRNSMGGAMMTPPEAMPAAPMPPPPPAPPKPKH